LPNVITIGAQSLKPRHTTATDTTTVAFQPAGGRATHTQWNPAFDRRSMLPSSSRHLGVSVSSTPN
jgi:hypothetical protein